MYALFQWTGKFQKLFEKIFRCALVEVLRMRVPGYLLPKMRYVVRKRSSVRWEKEIFFSKFNPKKNAFS